MLAESFGVSQTPIRDALLRLEQDGLVVVHPQSSTLVAPIDVDEAHETQFLRTALECEVARTITADPAAFDLRPAELVLDETEAIWAKHRDPLAFKPKNPSFHLAVAGAEPALASRTVAPYGGQPVRWHTARRKPSMAEGTLLYAQSGGVTAVINATASAVISASRSRKLRVLAARNGILGALREDLIDTSHESAAAIWALANTPGGAFGSCRVKLGSLEADRERYERLLEVLRAHGVRWFLYNGGNDSADTALKVSRLAGEFGYPLTCIGVPKTVDNDLAVTDCSPGFGSAAKYTAVSVRECALDVAAVADTSTKVFVYEVMGRHAGWLAAAAGLAGRSEHAAPHLILFPERPYDEAGFIAEVRRVVARFGYCIVVASEGIRRTDGRFVADSGGTDAFGHTQLGGVASFLAGRIKDTLGCKVRWTVPDYLQRSARNLASKTDLDHAQAVGAAAVQFALKGMNATMPVIRRISNTPYRWEIEVAELADIANKEKKLPEEFIQANGYGITPAARRYLAPLIHGQAMPPYRRDGMPAYVALKNTAVPRLLADWQE